MTKHEDFYCGKHVVRSMRDISEHDRSSSYGCRSVPLVSLPLTHGVMDELHVMLRVTDLLVASLIEHATDYDTKEQMAFCQNPVLYTSMNWSSASN